MKKPSKSFVVTNLGIAPLSMPNADVMTKAIENIEAMVAEAFLVPLPMLRQKSFITGTEVKLLNNPRWIGSTPTEITRSKTAATSSDQKTSLGKGPAVQYLHAVLKQKKRKNGKSD